MEYFTGKKFPDYFPEKFPPENVRKEKIKVYRLIIGDEITEEDFKSYHELGKDYKKNYRYPFIEYGLSVNASLSDLENKRLGSIKLKRRFKNIAFGNTYICTGIIENTPGEKDGTHMTYWIYEGIKPINYFKIV